VFGLEIGEDAFRERLHVTLLRTYPICRWSGELGPKIKEGDRQAPEGFYSITPGQDESEFRLLSRDQYRISECL
jgi:murein L,D-transpeptidase YafK